MVPPRGIARAASLQNNLASRATTPTALDVFGAPIVVTLRVTMGDMLCLTAFAYARCVIDTKDDDDDDDADADADADDDRARSSRTKPRTNALDARVDIARAFLYLRARAPTDGGRASSTGVTRDVCTMMMMRARRRQSVRRQCATTTR